MEMSNKSLALLLVVAIVISLGGTFISLNKLNQIVVFAPPRLTGRALTGSGQVNLTISTNSSCTVDNDVNFGSGKPTQTRTLTTDQNNNFDGFSCNGATPGTGNCWGLQINNTGNVRINVTFNSTKDGAELLGLGHQASDFAYLIDDSEIESNSCTTDGVSSFTATPKANTLLCRGLNYTDSTDVIIMDFNVSIDQNTAPGNKTTTINIYCIEE